MTFITALIALIIERFFHWSHLRHWRWFNKYQHWLAGRIANWPSVILLAICVLPFMIAAGMISCLLTPILYGVFKLIFGVIVLVYCLGPDNLWVQAFSTLNELHKEDPAIAIARVQSAFGIAAPENSQAFHQALTRAIFIAANERVFATVFWFVLLGPLGAVMYRSISMCAQQSELGLTKLATQLQQILDWLPVRLLTFIFALSGHFTAVFAIWKKEAASGLQMNDVILTDCGVGALALHGGKQLPEDGSAEKGALELFDRALIIGLVMLAMVVLIIL